MACGIGNFRFAEGCKSPFRQSVLPQPSEPRAGRIEMLGLDQTALDYRYPGE